MLINFQIMLLECLRIRYLLTLCTDIVIHWEDAVVDVGNQYLSIVCSNQIIIINIVVM